MVTKPPDAIRRLFGTQGVLPNFPPRYNVAPTQDVPVVSLQDGGRTLSLMRWGLVPAGTPVDAKGKPNTGRPLINARSETAASAAPFRHAFGARRCLIPADGYYEWDQEAKVPHLFRRQDRGLFALAGLWERWRDPAQKDAPPLTSCAIVTMEASTLVEPLHDRMPVILRPELWPAWLGESAAPLGDLLAVLAQGSDAGFDDTIVSKRVNSHLNDDPACIEEADADLADASDRLL